MRYLIDTCVISELVKKVPSKHVVEFVRELDEDRCYLSVLTLGELHKGIARLKDGKRKGGLQRWLDQDLRSRFEGQILPVDVEVAEKWGVVSAEAEGRGVSIPAVDGLIASTALVHGLTVITRNTSDMAPSGASLLNPWDL